MLEVNIYLFKYYSFCSGHSVYMYVHCIYAWTLTIGSKQANQTIVCSYSRFVEIRINDWINLKKMENYVIKTDVEKPYAIWPLP